MICTHCGKEIADDAIFCSQCGTRLVPETPLKPEAPAEPEEVPAPEVEEKVEETADIWTKAASIPAAPAAAAAVKAEPEAPRKPFLEEMQWDVSEYPDSNVIEKTDDIDFNWNTDPDKVEDPVPKAVVRPRPTPKETAPKSAESIRVSEIFDRVVPAQEARAAVKAQTEAPEEADGLDLSKFNTFNRKNAEFQQLLDKEYEKILDSGTIGKEQSQADAIAEERFDSRQEEMTMDQFLEKEGAVKRYEPEPLQSDVLMRIEAQEKKRAKEKAEEEARAKAAEEARAAAEAQKKAEIEQRNNEAEASAAAAEEIRLAEEAEIRQRTEEAAKQKAAEEAAHLAAIAERQAEAERRALEEKERKAAEEARLKAEAEQKAKEEAEARAKAELEAARAAEEEARKRAEAELNAAREAARIRAQEEASLAAQEEAKFQEARDRAQYEEEAQRQQARQDRADAVEAQVKDALAQTARMREEEEAKIKAALAGIRGGRFTNTIAAGEKMEEPEKPEKQEEVVVPTVQEAPAAAIPSVEDLLGQDHEPDLPEADQIEEAHQATRDQIDEMAKAREDFFADFPDADEMVSRAAEKAAPAQTRMVSKDDLLAGLDNTKKMSRDALHLEGEEDMIEAAADEAKDMAEAAAADTAEAAGEAGEAAQTAAADAAQTAAADIAQTAAADAGQTDFTGKLSEIDALLNQFASVAAPDDAEMPSADEVLEAAPSIDELAGDVEALKEAGSEISAPQMPAFEEAAAPIGEAVDKAEAALEDKAPAFAEEIPEAAEKAAGFVEEKPAFAEEVPAFAEETPAIAEEAPAIAEEAPAAAQEIPEVREEPEAVKEPEIPAAPAAEEKPGLEDTMIMPMPHVDEDDWMDSAAGAGAAAGVAAAAGTLTKKEQKKLEKAQAKEAKLAAKESKRAGKTAIAENAFGNDDYIDEEPVRAKGGAGRVILMIVLIILCIIFALELAGIGIKLLAPTSGAAEFIDNILNNIIHMITGGNDSGHWLA